MLNRLTLFTNNYVDFSRSADLFRSRNHRYTTEQILTRSAMVITTAVSAYLGAHYNSEEQSNCSDTTMAIATGTLGLLISHLYVVAPLIYKRYKASQDCQQCISEIKSIAKTIPDIQSAVLDQTLDHIMQLSLANDHRSNASQTWGRRKSLLSTLKDKLTSQDAPLLSALQTSEVESVMAAIEGTAPIVRAMMRN